MAFVKTLKFKYRIVISIIVIILFIAMILLMGWPSMHMHRCIQLNNFTGFTPDVKQHLFHRSFLPFQKSDTFSDVEKLLQLKRDPTKPKFYEAIIIREPIRLDDPSLADMINYSSDSNDSTLRQFQMAISKQSVYKESDPLIPKLLHDLATLPIVNVERKIYGTQLKLEIHYSNGMKGLFKPQRLPREAQIPDDQFYFQEFERHNSEIASFHLDRILNFRRTIPTVGRRLNMTSQIYDLATDEIRQTFFTSPANNICFYSNCTYYCSLLEPVCGEPDILEGSIAAFLPEFDQGHVWENVHPWRRTYSPRRKAAWEVDPDYCHDVRRQSLYTHDHARKLLDVMDVSIFDFLIGNMDRHHYEYFTIWNNDSTSIYLDNGRGFGKAFFDEMSILTPIIHCCLIRETTLTTLLRFHNGPKPLSVLMKESLNVDPIAPVLWEPHYIALDRRVEKILIEIKKCLHKNV